jgi:hypothetical protein
VKSRRTGQGYRLEAGILDCDLAYFDASGALTVTTVMAVS